MKILKKSVALILVLCTVVSLASYSTASAKSIDEDLPVVFIGGKGTTLIDKDGNVIYPLSVDIAGCAEQLVPSLIEANLKNDFDEFGEVLCDVIAEQFKDLPLDNNGNASNGTSTDFKWSRQTLSWSLPKADEKYEIYDYVFYYDWRLDPCEIADSFAAYIDDVLAVTGAPKVRIIGRCMGSNIVIAYLQEYGISKVEHCLFYVSTINGVVGCGAPFAGDFVIDPEAAARFGLDFGRDPVFTLGDDLANRILGEALVVLRDTYGIDLAIAAVKNVYDIIEAKVVPRLLLSTFATFPSYWSMIGDDYFDAAIDCVFSGREEEYAGLIAKICNYHDTIQTKSYSLLSQFKAEGLEISVIAKYGFQQVPVSKEYEALSDDTVELYRSSFGASCAELNTSFTDEYMEAAKLNGKAKYISPDRQVDCSTCLFPDNTWIIKDCTHTDFPPCIDSMMMEILRHPGQMTINDSPAYPQYTVYDKEAGTLSPMTGENFDTTERWEISFWQALIGLIKDLFTLISTKMSAG